MSYSETITRTDLANILNQVLPLIGSAILYSGTKVSSGTITLADAYTNYDFLLVSYKTNVDAFAEIYDCAKIASAPTDKYQGAISLVDSGTTYASTCKFSATDSTHLSVTNSGNNVNFVAGIVKIVGITSHDSKSGIAMDYIVEQGTATPDSYGIWTYRKWNSGVAECWRDFSANSFAPATAVGGFYGRVLSPYYFPTDLFIETPKGFFNLSYWGTGYFWGQMRLTSATTYQLALWRNDNASSSANGSIYAIGKWK